MKKIILIVLLLNSFVSFSQESLRISMKNSKQEVLSDSMLMTIVKLCDIDIDNLTVLPIDKMVDTVAFFKGKKYNCKSSKEKILFSNLNDLEPFYTEKKHNQTSKVFLKEKFMFCYISKVPNSKNKFEVFFYILE